MLDADGNDVEGALGTYNYCGLHGGPPTPQAQPQQGAGLALSNDELNVVISVPGGPPFVAWQVTSASDVTARPTATLSEGLQAAGSESISFAGPPKGIWTIVARLTFPGVTGQVDYYWRVIAP